MVLAFKTDDIGLTTATNHFEAEFQNQTRPVHYSQRVDFRNDGAVETSRWIEKVEAQRSHFVGRSEQAGIESSMEDTKSLFSRLKCKNTSSSREKTCDNHVAIGTSFKPKISKSVHKISTPWLVVAKDRKHVKSRDDSNYNKDDDNNNDDTGGAPSTRDSPTTSINAYIETEMQTKNSLRSVLLAGKRNGSVRGENVSASKPSMSTTKYDELSSHHSCYHIFPSNTSGDFTGVEIQRIATENRDDTDSNGKHIIESAEPLANHKVNNRQNDGNVSHNNSPEFESYNNESSASIAKDNFSYSNDATGVLNNHKSRGSRIRMVQSAMHRKNRTSSNISSSSIDMQFTSPRTKQSNEISEELGYEAYRTMADEQISVKCAESKIPTPRRRTSRSPSPSRLRRNLEFKESATADYDRQLLMGLEMQRDMDRMSLTFLGMVNESPGPSSNFRIERKPSRENIAGFSIFPSSMSCLNPTLQLDECQRTENDYHKDSFDKNKRLQLEKRMSSPTRSRRMTNNFCCGASSALLFNVKDNDPIWKFYDDFEVMHQKPNTGRLSLESKARDSREYQKLQTQKDTKNFETNGEQRLLNDEDDRFDKFGRLNSNDVTKDYTLKDQLISENSRNQIGYGENQTPTPSESNHHYMQNQTTDVDLTQNRYFIPSDDYLLNDEREIEYNTTYENNSKNIQYKSLMRYPEHLRYDQEESLPNKEAMLDQMRHAIQNSSAQLESSENVKATDSSSEERYSVMTMETECSDESSYASYYPHKQRTRLREFDSE